MKLLWWLLFLLSIGKSVAENGASCAYHDTLFDIGLAKVLNSTKFEAIPLPDIYERVGKWFNVWIRLHDGAFYYLKNLKRGTRNSIRVTDAGVDVVFQVEGGMFRVYYPRGHVKAPFLDTDIRVDVYFPHISLALYVREPVPTHLTLEAFASETKQAAVIVINEGESSIVFDLGKQFKLDDIENKVTEEVGTVIHKLGHQFLGMVELYARNGTNLGDVKQPRPETEYTGDIFVNIFANRYRNEDIGPDIYNPITWNDTSAWGIFDFCIKRMVLHNGLDPLTLTDVSDITWNGRTFQILNVTVDGLINIRRGGDIFVSAEECGLVARVALFFQNIKVRIYAKSSVVTGRLDVHIYEVNAVLEVREVNKTLQVVDYQLNFTMPVDTDTYILTPLVGPIVAYFIGPPHKTLTEDETNTLEDASRRYIEAVVLKVEEFIKDPASYMPWDTSIMNAFRRYKNEG